MKYLHGARLRRVACATVVLGSTLAVLAPQAANATVVTTTEKGTTACTIPGLFSGNLALKTKTTYDNGPIAVGASESASVKASVTVPEALNQAAWNTLDARSYKGTVTHSWVDNNLATPSPYDATSNNTIVIAPTNLPTGGNASSKLKFKIPNGGPFTATGSGTDNAVAGDPTNGFATANVTYYSKANEGGHVITTLTATCNTPVATGSGPFVIATITIS